MQISEQFFSPQEVEALLAAPGRERQRAFFSIWTRKEAYVKALGEGLYVPFSEFDVSVCSEAQIVESSSECSSHKSHRWSLLELTLGADYVGAIAVEGDTPQLRYWHWDCDEPSSQTV